MLKRIALHRRNGFIALALALGLVVTFGLHSRGLLAQGPVSYTPGVEGQIWQQLPSLGRGLDMNERPISTNTALIDPTGNVWPCTVSGGFPVLCYPSGNVNAVGSYATSIAYEYNGS